MSFKEVGRRLPTAVSAEGVRKKVVRALGKLQRGLAAEGEGGEDMALLRSLLFS